MKVLVPNFSVGRNWGAVVAATAAIGARNGSAKIDEKNLKFRTRKKKIAQKMKQKR
jgi:hypothetical protein